VSSNLAFTSKLVFVKPEKVEETLVERKITVAPISREKGKEIMVERNEAVAPTSQGKKGKKIHVESYVPHPKSRFVHPPRKQPFSKVCSHLPSLWKSWSYST
jgi:hypothetical protein